jgi:diguanylate cyclase (GGDEF)-like protein
MHKLKAGKNYIVYAIAALALVMLAVLVFLFTVEREVVKVKVEETKHNEMRVVSLENDLIAHTLDGVVSDLKYLSHAFDTALLSSNDYQSVSENWSIFARDRGIYDQIRYIDITGDERIRINLVDGNAYAVPNAELQNKGDRYYFTSTIQMAPGTVYISKLDLNIENGVIEMPMKPMLRIASPIYDPSGKVQGIIVLNYLAQEMLNRFQTFAGNSFGEMVLLNSEGYWLSSENSTDEWHFMFEAQQDDSFANRFPDLWQQIRAGQSQFTTANGLITSHVVQLDETVPDALNVTFGDGEWYIVSMIAADDVYYKVDSSAILKSIIQTNGMLFILLVGISVLTGYLVYLNRKKYNEIKYFSEYDLLTQFYNRRAGYQRIDAIMQEHYRDPIDISLCFLDVNGLKSVNDALGHPFGDELLSTAARLIREHLSESDFAIRLGGDEFLIVFIHKNEEEAEAVWQQIVAAFETINNLEERPYVISLSHGIVILNSSRVMAIDEHLQRADALMYEEKAMLKKDLLIVRSPRRA